MQMGEYFALSENGSLTYSVYSTSVCSSLGSICFTSKARLRLRLPHLIWSGGPHSTYLTFPNSGAFFPTTRPPPKTRGINKRVDITLLSLSLLGAHIVNVSITPPQNHASMAGRIRDYPVVRDLEWKSTDEVSALFRLISVIY